MVETGYSVWFWLVLSVLLIQKARFQLHMPQANDDHHSSESMGVALCRHLDKKCQYYSELLHRSLQAKQLEPLGFKSLRDERIY